MIRRTTQPAVEPVTLEEAKLHLRVDHSDEDALIGTLIAAARMDCESRTGRTLISSGWRVTLDEFPDAIELRMPPVSGVTSVQYRDADGVVRTLAGSAYTVDAVSEPGYVVPAINQEWPSTDTGINAVQVDYLAGYGAEADDVPAPLRQWILLAVGDMYARRERSSEAPAVPHQFVDGLLDPFKVYG